MVDKPTSTSTRSLVAVEDFLPLTPASFHILLVLAGGATHGYAIMQEVGHVTEGLVHLGPGTLYRSIQRLLDDGLVEEVSSAAASGNDDRRQYRLTLLGRRVACAEAGRLAVLVRAARRRGLLEPQTSSRRGANP
ncbi:MAG TPA: PadR family transcriptional regulator [Kofleriaceae bacterium]|jgi:DNA-binding PadR family transcriptional regulator